MALSNLIWWPWFGLGVDEPVVGDVLLAGDRRPRHEIIRRRQISQDEEDLLIAVMLAER